MMGRFALLLHDHPAPHLDFMIHKEGVLWTWRLPRWPLGRERIEAIRLPDHRIAYLDYEGPVSGDRGRVRRLLGGWVTIETETSGALRLRQQGVDSPAVWGLIPQGDGWFFAKMESGDGSAIH